MALNQNPDIPAPRARIPCFAHYPDHVALRLLAWPQHMTTRSRSRAFGWLVPEQYQPDALKGFQLPDLQRSTRKPCCGWTVYRVPGPWIAEGGTKRTRWIWRERVLVVLRELLVRADPDGELGQGRML